MRLRRSWPERLFIAFGVLVILAATIGSHYVDGWRYVLPYWLSAAATGAALGQFIYGTKHRGRYVGRVIWLGPIDGFVTAYADDAEPFSRWGITRTQLVEVRVMHDTVGKAFASHLPDADA